MTAKTATPERQCRDCGCRLASLKGYVRCSNCRAGSPCRRCAYCRRRLRSHNRTGVCWPCSHKPAAVNPTADPAPEYQTCRRCGHPWGSLDTGYCDDCHGHFDRLAEMASRLHSAARSDPTYGAGVRTGRVVVDARDNPC